MKAIENRAYSLNLIWFFMLIMLSITPAQQIAILDIAPVEIPEDDALTLSDHFREVISSKIGESPMPPEIIREVLAGDKVNNRWCAEEWCGKEVGQLLNAQKVIVSSIWKDDEIYRINGLLIEMDSDSVTQIHQFDFSGEHESLLTEVEIMAFSLFNKPFTEELKFQHQYINERSLALQGITEKRMRLSATLLSTAFPGLGQLYLKRKIWGGIWIGTQVVLGSAALKQYLTWHKAYDDFYEFEELYLASTNVSEISDYRNEMLRNYDIAKKSIDRRKDFTQTIFILWGLNIMQSYYMSPSTDEILEKISVRFSHNPLNNEFQLRFSFAIK